VWAAARSRPDRAPIAPPSCSLVFMSPEASPSWRSSTPATVAIEIGINANAVPVATADGRRNRRGPARENLGSVRPFDGNTEYVPLYGCDRCGFTSAAFRPEAAATHRLEYPGCDGAIRIIFRSDDRGRGLPQPDDPASALAVGFEVRHASAVQSGGALLLRERVAADDTLRLSVLGDLDVAGAVTLATRLEELKAADHRVCLDLSHLTFIDSSGIQALIVALIDARMSGWPLEVAPEVSPGVARATQITGIAQILWPEDPGATPGKPSTTSARTT
jgi:anti-anti-sigma factor